MRDIKFRVWNKAQECWLNNTGVEGMGAMFRLLSGPVEIIMQFTGLLDKNGKEIWEGDILQKGTKSPRIKFEVISHRDGWFGKNNRSGEYKRLSAIYPLECDIIGNIYENKELLK